MPPIEHKLKKPKGDLKIREAGPDYKPGAPRGTVRDISHLFNTLDRKNLEQLKAVTPKHEQGPTIKHYEEALNLYEHLEKQKSLTRFSSTELSGLLENPFINLIPQTILESSMPEPPKPPEPIKMSPTDMQNSKQAFLIANALADAIKREQKEAEFANLDWKKPTHMDPKLWKGITRSLRRNLGLPVEE